MKIEYVDQKVSLKRTVETGTEDQQKVVKTILENVRKYGDKAVKEYTEKFDHVNLQDYQVTEAEITSAYETLEPSFIAIMKEAAANIREFHSQQISRSWMTMKEDGTMLGQKVTPLDRVGVYVPGGTAAYPSSVFMNVIPAQVAGVKRIAMISPPKKDGKLSSEVLAAARILGITEIYKIGGAQAVAALAYGTETIHPVDKIVGPGNLFVALAKREVFGLVDIDMFAGPSEIAVLADDTSNAKEVASDLLSQAEHDRHASCILVTPSLELAKKVATELEQQVKTLPREAIARDAIEAYGHLYVTANLAEAIEVVNQLAPEHLEIQTEDALTVAGKIRHAGAIFLGRYSAEVVGDYFAGPNHILPTNGTARFSSPLGVEDFVKKSNLISYSKQAFDQHASKIATFARVEGLEAHARAIESRGV